MEKSYQLLFFISFIALLLTDVSNTQLDKSNQHEAENCTLLNNQQGFCTQYRNCDYAKKLSIRGQSIKIEKCTRNNFICCPKPEKIRTLSPDYPKSIKFKEALCEDKISISPIVLNLRGGEIVDIGEFPFYASLGYKVNDKIEYLCGGSLIADDIVITAAHCVNRREYPPVIVKLGKVSQFLNIRML